MPIGKANPGATGEYASQTPQQNGLHIWELITPAYRLDEMVLSAETKDQILDVIAYFQNEHRLMNEWGLEEKYGKRRGLAVNLYGPSGTGKTMAAHGILRELSLPMLLVNSADIESKYVGETAKNLSALFKEALERGAAIFFDEADALLSKRVTNMTSATDVSVNQTRSVLLNLLNDYQGVILFASNFIENYDAAFLRRIRFHIRFSLPDQAQRRKLWEVYIPGKMPCTPDFAALAEKYPGVSGSDISNAVFNAAVSAARDGAVTVDQSRFEKAIARILAVKTENAGNRIYISERAVSSEEVPEYIKRSFEA